MNLKNLNTFGIDVNASSYIELKSEKESIELLSSRKLDTSECLVLGGGSNILFTSDFKGTILHPTFNKITMVARGEKKVHIAVDAAVKWDDLVSWAVDMDLGGIENLSLIPGHTGAAPIQNIGAYGSEAAEVITKVRTLSLADGTVMEFTGEECNFGYRDSIFKKELKGKILITTVYIELTPRPSKFNLSYGDLERRVFEKGEPNLYNIRETVIDIRKEKLPDPGELGNAGSFFKNPVLDKAIAHRIAAEHPGLPLWPAGDEKQKVSAAWLIENAGFKGYRQGNAGVHHRQPLVLVNHGDASGTEIIELAIRIRESVRERFGITLEFEVNII